MRSWRPDEKHAAPPGLPLQQFPVEQQRYMQQLHQSVQEIYQLLIRTQNEKALLEAQVRALENNR